MNKQRPIGFKPDPRVGRKGDCGKSAQDWIMGRYQVTIDKDSGIRNDPNDWSDNPRYLLDLIKSMVRVSIETVRIVKCLPALNEQ